MSNSKPPASLWQAVKLSQELLLPCDRFDVEKSQNDIFAWLRDTTNGNEECVCIATLLGSIYLRTLLMFSSVRKIFIRGHVFINQNSKDIVMSVVYEFYALTCLNTDPSTLEKSKLIC